MPLVKIPRNAFCTLLGAVVLSLLFPGVSHAQGVTANEAATLQAEISRLQAELPRLDAEIRKTDSLRNSEKALQEKILTGRGQERQKREEEIASLEARLRESGLKTDAEKRKTAAVDNSIEELQAREKAVIQRLTRLTADFEQQIRNSVPFEREDRLARAASLRKDLEAGRSSVEEAFGRLKALYRDEIRFGDEVALLSKPIIRNTGETVNAQLLRIGNQWLVYADEEGKAFGVLQRRLRGDSLDYSWRENLSFAEREAVRTALDVKGSKKPPRLVTLPLSLSLRSDAEIRAENNGGNRE